MKLDIIAFVGPSITIDEAKSILPSAYYLPPARCGDIIQVLRLKPKIIVIIDGFFDNTAAVWHKEILFAIEQGVEVYGAASMGALRAAELSNLGMIGQGKIFHDYLSETITDDDEVCVLHRPQTSDFLPVSDAMVNIRATIDRAVNEKVIEKHYANKIIDRAKAQFYRDRKLMDVILELENEGISSPGFSDWIHNGGYVNQKKQDAQDLLSYIENGKTNNDALCHQNFVHKTIFFRTIQRDAMCKPFNMDYPWLPDSERIALFSRLLGNVYIVNQCLAYLISVTCAIVENEEDFKNSDRGNNFSYRIKLIDFALASLQHIENLSFLEQTYQSYAQIFLKLDDDDMEDEIIKKSITLFSKLWIYFDIKLQEANLNEIKLMRLQNYVDKWRKERDLLTVEKTLTWMRAHRLEESQFEKMMNSFVRFDCLVVRNNLDFLNVRIDGTVFWLWDALRLTDADKKAKALLENIDLRQQAIERIYNAPLQRDDFLFKLDFIGGESQLRKLALVDTLIRA